VKSFYLISTTEGCATNLLENSKYRDYYLSLGYLQAASPAEADIIFINTCGYNRQMEDRAARIISEFQSLYKNKEILIAGCLPKINPARVGKFFHGKIFEADDAEFKKRQSHEFSKKDLARLSFNHRFVSALRPWVFGVEKALGVCFQPVHNIFDSVVISEEYFYVTISQGCVGKCTYCAIKRAKGPLVSRTIAEIRNDFDSGYARGYRKFWLLGDDIACWGQDSGADIVELLPELLANRPDIQIVLNYFDPHYLLKYSASLEGILGDSRFVCINIPMQTGSARILERMGRDYNIQEVLSVIARIKNINPALAVKTNLMIGFPGEEWRDFFQTLRLVWKFDAVLALKYTPRPHTVAARYENQVPGGVVLLRSALMSGSILIRHGAVVFLSIAQAITQAMKDSKNAPGNA